MNDKELDNLAKNILDKSNIITANDVSKIFDKLQGRMIQLALNEEAKYHVSTTDSDNNRLNGYSSNKEVKTKSGEFKIKMPRDRKGSFQPIIVKKRQKIVEDFADLAILLYSKGNSLNDIKDIVKKLYSISISTEYISNLISTIKKDVIIWQNRTLKSMYSILYVDCMYVPVIKDGRSKKVAIYVILGIGLDGKKEVVGTWIGNGSESASYWIGIFEELKERGVKDILYIAMDGLTGLKAGIETVYPLAKAQRCVVHLVRNLYSTLPKKEAKNVIKDFKKIYKSSNKEIAEEEYNTFKKKYKDNKKLLKKVDNMMEHIYPLFEETVNIRKLIYTNNAIQSVNSCLTKLTKGKGVFRNEQSIHQVLYLRIKDLEEKWSKGIKGWNSILNELIIIHEERISKYLN